MLMFIIHKIVIFSNVYYLDNADGNTILFKEFADTSESIDINKINVLAKINLLEIE